MFKTYLFTFSIAIMGYVAFGQTQMDNLLISAKKYNKAFIDKDFEALTAMTIPTVVNLAGGDEEFASISKSTLEVYANASIVFVSIDPNSPGEILPADKDLHAILPQTIVMKVGDVKYRKIAYYLASSSDQGLTWTFLDLEPYDVESLKEYVPNFTGELAIPEVGMPEEVDGKR